LVITNIWLGGLAVLIVMGIAINLSLWLRRHAPPGGFFSDSDRAAGIFGSIGTLFSVLLALVILLSVETYSDTKAHANAEADLVLEQFQLARLFPSNDQFNVQSQLICYGRGVMNSEWQLMSRNEQSPVVDEWQGSLDATIDTVGVDGAKAEQGFSLFLQQTLQRQEERRGRLQGAEGSLPPLVWPVLLLGALAMLGHVVYYADSDERMSTQILQVSLITVLLGSSLLLINALDHPFSDHPGKIAPDKMHFSVAQMEGDLASTINADDLTATLPCDDDGYPKPNEPQVKSFPSGSTMEKIAARGQVRIGVSNSIALFGEVDPVSGVVNGFDADLGREIATELGLREDQIEFVDTAVEDRIPYLQQGKVDLVIEVMTINSARKQQVEFSRPYFLAGQSILVDKTNRNIGGLRNLAGKEVCVVPGSTSVESLGQLAPTAQLVFMPDFPTCIAALKRGEVNAVSTDDIILAGFAAADSDLTLVGGQFTKEPYGVAVPKGQKDFAMFINAVINQMIEDGRWGKLYYQYLGDIPGLASIKDAKTRLPFGVDD
jgi:ABC-type amino acid transport substrate-binding protein